MKNFPLKATYIDELSSLMPAINWSNEQWLKEFDYMQDVGIETLVITKGWCDGKCLYPSKSFPTLKKEGEDLLLLILQQAEKRNMKVFIGGYMTSNSWNVNGVENEIEVNKVFAEEILERYGYFKSFVGWHIPHEVCSAGNISALLDGIGEFYRERTPDKLVMYSPQFRSAITSYNDYSAERTVREWDIILRDSAKYIDICAFQDGTVGLNKYEEYIKAAKTICDKHGIRLWACVETFERDVRKMYFPHNFELLRERIEIAKKYVENCVANEFSRFLSPQSIFESARNLNSTYKNYYTIKGE